MGGRTLRRLGQPVLIALGLAAAAAWRGELSPGIVLFLTMAMIWAVIRSWYDTDHLPVSARHRQGRERTLVFLVGVGMLYLPAIAVATPFLDFARYGTPVWLLALGALPAVCGIWLFWLSHADLGKNWSPVLELRESHALVTGGIYAHIRHPMYAAIFLIVAAQFAFLGNLLAGPAGLLAFALLYLDRIASEEAMMADRFGADWTRYVAKTGRILPMAKRPHADGAA